MKFCLYLKRYLYKYNIEHNGNMHREAIPGGSLQELARILPICDMPVMMLSYATTGILKKDVILALAWNLYWLTDTGLTPLLHNVDVRSLGVHTEMPSRGFMVRKVTLVLAAKSFLFHGISYNTVLSLGIATSLFRVQAQRMLGSKPQVRLSQLLLGGDVLDTFYANCTVITYNTNFLSNMYAAEVGWRSDLSILDITALYKYLRSGVALPRRYKPYTSASDILTKLGRLPLAVTSKLLGILMEQTSLMVCMSRLLQITRMMQAVADIPVNMC